MTKQDKFWLNCRLLIYVLGFLFFLWIPWHYIADGPVFCLFRRILGIKCPGCGMTRAFWQIIHLHIRQAYEYNVFSLLVFPALVGLIVRDVWLSIQDW